MVESGSIRVVREFAGGLVGVRSGNLHARIPESVVELSSAIGDRIQQGDVVVYLDKGGSSSRYFQAQASFENARKTFNKMKKPVRAEGYFGRPSSTMPKVALRSPALIFRTPASR